TEVGRVGFECERLDGMHLNVDFCPIRLIDEDGRPAPAGTPGEVVVSSLRNRAMVLLNYRIGDRAILDPEPCPCGRTLPRLRRLEGRRSDVLRLTDGRSLSAFMMEALFRDALRPTRKVQLAQPTPGVVHWRIVPFAGADPDALSAAIRARAEEILGEG